jgi:hypothetical protein
MLQSKVAEIGQDSKVGDLDRLTEAWVKSSFEVEPITESMRPTNEFNS